FDAKVKDNLRIICVDYGPYSTHGYWQLLALQKTETMLAAAASNTDPAVHNAALALSSAARVPAWSIPAIQPLCEASLSTGSMGPKAPRGQTGTVGTLLDRYQ